MLPLAPVVSYKREPVQSMLFFNVGRRVAFMRTLVDRRCLPIVMGSKLELWLPCPAGGSPELHHSLQTHKKIQHEHDSRAVTPFAALEQRHEWPPSTDTLAKFRPQRSPLPHLHHVDH